MKFTTIDDNWEPTEENIARLPQKFREWLQKRTDNDYEQAHSDAYERGYRDGLYYAGGSLH